MATVSVEETYDYTYFDNQVLEFNFPGHPAPPLGMLQALRSSLSLGCLY